MSKWNIKDIENKNLKFNATPTGKSKLPKPVHPQILFFRNHLTSLKIEHVTEHQFLDDRKFRFDIAIIDLKIAIEYEGIITDQYRKGSTKKVGSEISRHTSITGITNDCTKYNLASIHGWRLLRYTALNYKDFPSQLKQMIEI